MICETHCLKVLTRCILYLQLMFDKSCWKKKNSEKEGVQQPNLNIFKFSKVVSIKTFRWIFQLLFPKKLRTVVIHNNQVYLIFCDNHGCKRWYPEGVWWNFYCPTPLWWTVSSDTAFERIACGLCSWRGCVHEGVLHTYWQFFLELVGRWQSLTLCDIWHTHGKCYI